MVRAQMSMEFITGVAIMLVIYVLAIGAYSYYTENNVIESSFAEHICYKVSEGINAAVIGGDGFSINISIPYTVYSDYLSYIQISNNYTATVEWGNRISACSVVTNNITVLPIFPGKISATNIDGQIYMTSVNISQSRYQAGESAFISAQYIKGVDANLTIFYINGTARLGPIIRTASSNTVSYNWDTTGVPSGEYTIFVRDNNYPNMNAERMVEII